MPRLKVHFKFRGTFKTKPDEREFVRVLENIIERETNTLLAGHPTAELEWVKFGPIRPDSEVESDGT